MVWRRRPYLNPQGPKKLVFVVSLHNLFRSSPAWTRCFGSNSALAVIDYGGTPLPEPSNPELAVQQMPKVCIAMLIWFMVRRLMRCQFQTVGLRWRILAAALAICQHPALGLQFFQRLSRLRTQQTPRFNGGASGFVKRSRTRCAVKFLHSSIKSRNLLFLLETFFLPLNSVQTLVDARQLRQLNLLAVFRLE